MPLRYSATRSQSRALMPSFVHASGEVDGGSHGFPKSLRARNGLSSRKLNESKPHIRFWYSRIVRVIQECGSNSPPLSSASNLGDEYVIPLAMADADVADDEDSVADDDDMPTALTMTTVCSPVARTAFWPM
mmetsp:Transcript_27825/g.38684  ORF Transcript_27825/g.38684 Transcript_27825/m.38684 type:complete len:132 (+) Transcript_27825:509-904(+)